jgi:Phospholipase_D-nuclease N-terminal
MALFDAGGLILVGLLLFWFWAIYDVVTTEPSQVRNLPKVMWVVVVLLLSPLALDLGPILWMLLGRPVRTTGVANHPQAQRRPRRAPVPEPETERDSAQRVVTDRRSAELDRMLEEWERTRRDEAAPES